MMSAATPLLAFRYNPALADAAEPQNPFSLDSKRIKSSLMHYLQGENRYSALRRTDSARADKLQGAFEASTIKRMEQMQVRATLHSHTCALARLAAAIVHDWCGSLSAPAFYSARLWTRTSYSTC